MPLIPVELNYEAIESTFASTSDAYDRMSSILDKYSHSIWITSLTSLDPFNNIFPSDEGIMEVMSLEETPLDDGHQRSSFLLKIELETHSTVSPDPPIPILPYDILSEGNLGVIYDTVPIDISIKPGIVENIHIDASYSPKEIKVYRAFFK